MAAKRYSDDDLLDALRGAASQITGLLSVVKYDQVRTRDLPSSALIIQRFKSWSNALNSAGLDFNQVNQVFESKFTLDDAIACTRQYLAQTPKPSYQDFAKWLRRKSKAPSAQTCRNLAGSWQKLLTAAKS